MSGLLGMTKVIAIHSFKGGTGKTLVASNLACVLAQMKKSVYLFDLDFRAPSLHIIFASQPKKWMNDFLLGNADIEDVLVDLTKNFGLAGNLNVGFASPSLEAIQEMMTKDRKREMKALQYLLGLRDKLSQKRDADYLIFDTSPGVQYSSMNSIVASDVTLVVATNDEADLDGTQRMIKNLYEAFEKKALILVNRALCESDFTEDRRRSLSERFSTALGIPILSTIPLFCDLLQFNRNSIVALENPRHPFSQALMGIAKNL